MPPAAANGVPQSEVHLVDGVLQPLLAPLPWLNLSAFQSLPALCPLTSATQQRLEQQLMPGEPIVDNIQHTAYNIQTTVFFAEHQESRARHIGPMDCMRRLIRVLIALMPDTAVLLGGEGVDAGGKK